MDLKVHVKLYSQIKNSELRVIESCLRLIHQRGGKVPLTVPIEADVVEILKGGMKSSGVPEEDVESEVKLLLEEANKRLLPKSELDWIKQNPRSCYWVWLHTLRFQYYASPMHPTYPPANGVSFQYANSYSQLQLNQMPSSTKERFDEVVKFLDRVGQPLEWQRSLVADLRRQWGIIFSARKPFPWLKRGDEEQCWWAWEYLKKVSSSPNRPSVADINPVDVGELYLAIYAAFDAWAALNDSKRLFLVDFNKAWQQKKHRENRQGKKACNFVLREDVKSKLDEMAASRGMKLNQLVEELIEREYGKVVRLR